MTKKVTTISIDEDILIMAKKELPNLSIFVEDCLKAFLGFNKSELRTIDENLDVIKNAMLNIQIISAKDNEININNNFNTAEQNKAWSKIWRNYRNNINLNNDEWEEAGLILNTSVSDLKELVEVLEFTCNRDEILKCDEWAFAKKYLK